MPILSDQDRKTLETRFKKDLKRDVTLTLFTARSFGGLILPGRECQTCEQTEELLTEITEISSHIKLTVKDFYTEAEEALERGIDRIPCITLQAEGDEIHTHTGNTHTDTNTHKHIHTYTHTYTHIHKHIHTHP